jgi:hypothetical protein
MKEREIVASPEKRLHTASNPSGAADCNGMTGCLKGDVRWASSPSTEKTLITKEKEEKMEEEDQQQTEKVLTIGHLECTITQELRKYKIAIAVIQETRWNKSTPQALTSNGYNIYTSSLANSHEFGTALHQSTSVSA